MRLLRNPNATKVVIVSIRLMNAQRLSSRENVTEARFVLHCCLCTNPRRLSLRSVRLHIINTRQDWEQWGHTRRRRRCRNLTNRMSDRSTRTGCRLGELAPSPNSCLGQRRLHRRLGTYRNRSVDWQANNWSRAERPSMGTPHTSMWGMGTGKSRNCRKNVGGQTRRIHWVRTTRQIDWRRH